MVGLGLGSAYAFMSVIMLNGRVRAWECVCLHVDGVFVDPGLLNCSYRVVRVRARVGIRGACHQPPLMVIYSRGIPFNEV